MRRLWRRHLAVSLVLTLALSAGCASAPIRKADVAALEDADRKILQGCYDCLLEARAIYRRVAVGTARPMVLPRLFEVALLIALREKELALDASAALAEARDLARDLPAAFEADRYLALVEAVPPDDVGMPRRAITVFRADRASFVPRITDELAWLATGALRPAARDYLALAIDCAYPIRRGAVRPAGPAGPRDPPAGAPPLIAYRTAICTFLSQPGLFRTRANDDRFVEASAYLARFDIAVAEQNGPGRARERLAEAEARFGTSPMVTLLSANLQRLMGNCAEALKYYDRTIANQAVHEGAWLGRVICLSHLERREEAIRAATHLIGLDLHNLSEAYYWRAWNRHAGGELDLARADVEQARTRASSGDILTLAGIIEHDQEALDAAERDLNAARAFPGSGDSNCTAMWYLGLVHLKRKTWLTSGRQFEDAMLCYENAASYARLKRSSMLARVDLDPDWQALQVAALDKAIAASIKQFHAAALNAANFYASGANIPAAKRLIEIAARDPSLAESVAKLREWLKDKAM
jgi:tetratricopeptide (TPR) repeat protein